VIGLFTLNNSAKINKQNITTTMQTGQQFHF
jgi:hypothetical protein